MKLSLATLFIPFASASYERIAGYEPGSQVTDHNAMDLDQAAFERSLAESTVDSFVDAKAIYQEGGNSKSYAMITLTTGLTSRIEKGDAIIGTTVDGDTVTAKSYGVAEAGATTLKVQYPTIDVQDGHVKCKVGALQPQDHVLGGCLEATGSVDIAGVSYNYSYTVDTDNKNGRTIAGFSTSAQSKMLDGCPGCPYKEYKKFYDYYGEADYADQWVTHALDGTKTNFDKGNADFSRYSLTGRTECAKKGSAYMNIYMYVIREFEDALDDCQRNCIDCNDGSVHAWDEGVAFYTGSLEGTEGKGDGKLLHALADKRCKNYKTCGLNGDELEGTSYINYELFNLFTLGQYNLVTGKCDAVRGNIDRIVELMSVPLIQGTLRYAYKVDALEGAEKEKAEGAVFAASVLPILHDCSADDAQTVYNNMMVDASSTDHKAVKTAFENNYECMGINGALVGGLWNSATSDYYEGMEPKKDSSTGGGRNNLAIGLGVGFGIAGLLGIAFIVYMIRKEKQGKPIFMNSSGDAIDV